MNSLPDFKDDKRLWRKQAWGMVCIAFFCATLSLRIPLLIFWGNVGAVAIPPWTLIPPTIGIGISIILLFYWSAQQPCQYEPRYLKDCGVSSAVWENLPLLGKMILIFSGLILFAVLLSMVFSPHLRT